MLIYIRCSFRTEAMYQRLMACRGSGYLHWGRTIPSTSKTPLGRKSPDSAGINRHEVANERVVQEGSSDPPGPETCEGSSNAALEALDRGICRLGIELRNT